MMLFRLNYNWTDKFLYFRLHNDKIEKLENRFHFIIIILLQKLQYILKRENHSKWIKTDDQLLTQLLSFSRRKYTNLS